MPPRKRKAAAPPSAPPADPPASEEKEEEERPSKEFRRAEDPSAERYDANGTKGLLRLPFELQEEILSAFLHPTLWTTVGYQTAPVISPEYNERNEVLRVLASTCVVWREAFVERLWRDVLICTIGVGTNPMSFFKTVGEMMRRRCEGLLESPEVARYVRKISIVITRYQAPVLMPLLAKCLSALPNLETLHVLHAHNQMTTSIRLAFENVTLPSVRTLAVPDYCHEMLRSCPGAIKVHCTAENGSKLIGAVAKRCGLLEEFAGLRVDGNGLKRLAKAAPKLHTLQWQYPLPADVHLLSLFKNLRILKIDLNCHIGMSQAWKGEALEGIRKVLSELPPLAVGDGNTTAASSRKQRQLWYAAASVDPSVVATESTWGRRARARARGNWKEGKYDTIEYF